MAPKNKENANNRKKRDTSEDDDDVDYRRRRDRNNQVKCKKIHKYLSLIICLFVYSLLFFYINQYFN